MEVRPAHAQAAREMRRVDVNWVQVRLDFEAGASQREVATRYGVSHTAIQKRVAKEGWNQNLKAAIKHQTARQVAGIVATDNQAARDSKVADEAAKRAELLKRHRLEWDFVRSYTSQAMNEAAKVDAGRLVLSTGDQHQDALRHMRFAKVATDTLRARQDAERVAFGLDGQDDGGDELSDEHAAIRIMQILNAAAERDG